MPCPGFFISSHLAAPRAQLLDDDADVLLGHVDHQLLVRLQPLAVGARRG